MTAMCSPQFHRDHGIDTLFFGNGAASVCGSSLPGTTIAGTLAPQYGFFCLISTDISYNSMENTSNVLARLLGDESDVKVSSNTVLHTPFHERPKLKEDDSDPYTCSWMMAYVTK